MCECYSCILPDSIQKSHRKRREDIKIVVFQTLNLVVQNGVGLQNHVNNIISANNVDINKSTDEKLILGHNLLLRNIMQTNFLPSWGFSSHDLNMVFVIWALLLVDLTMASNSYVQRYLCKEYRTILDRHVWAGSKWNDATLIFL